MQEPVLHLSLGVDSFQHSKGVLQSTAAMTAQEPAQPAESQEALHDAPLDPDSNSGPIAVTGMAGEGEEATIGEQEDDPAGAVLYIDLTCCRVSSEWDAREHRKTC